MASRNTTLLAVALGLTFMACATGQPGPTRLAATACSWTDRASAWPDAHHTVWVGQRQSLVNPRQTLRRWLRATLVDSRQISLR